jgi:hypothetical protein
MRTQSEFFSLFSLKEHIRPDFSDMNGEKSYLVQACEDWQPAPPMVIKKRISEGMYVVEGASASEIYDDPHVGSVSKHPKVRLM